MRKGLAEILIEANEKDSIEDRIKIFRENDSPSLQKLMKYAFDKDTKFVLPNGAPPFEKNDFPGNQGLLYGEMRRLYLFVEGEAPQNITPLKREMLFIQLLETVDPNDADLLIAVKDKNVDKKWKKITKTFIKKVYPGLIEE